MSFAASQTLSRWRRNRDAPLTTYGADSIQGRLLSSFGRPFSLAGTESGVTRQILILESDHRPSARHAGEGVPCMPYGAQSAARRL
jgi:hypothetical protein